jgi:hypothetical protein
MLGAQKFSVNVVLDWTTDCAWLAVCVAVRVRLYCAKCLERVLSKLVALFSLLHAHGHIHTSAILRPPPEQHF